MKKLLTLFMMLAFWSGGVMNAIAQDSDSVEMAEIMRSSGKIYVVVAVLGVVFIGIIIYLISLDRKIGKLEQQVNEAGIGTNIKK